MFDKLRNKLKKQAVETEPVYDPEYPVSNVYLGKCDNYNEYLGAMMGKDGKTIGCYPYTYPRCDAFLIRSDSFTEGCGIAKKLTGENAGTIFKYVNHSSLLVMDKDDNGKDRLYLIKSYDNISRLLDEQKAFLKLSEINELIDRANKASQIESRTEAFNKRKAEDIVRKELGLSEMGADE